MGVRELNARKCRRSARPVGLHPRAAAIGIPGLSVWRRTSRAGDGWGEEHHGWSRRGMMAWGSREHWPITVFALRCMVA